jgi:hypothetical protein
MFRKLTLALGATAALAITALAPTSASAWHHHHSHGWRHGFGFGIYAPVVAAAPVGCYIVKRWVDTAYGPRLRRVEVCS